MNKMSEATNAVTKIENYVAGGRVPTSTGRGQDIFNPATGEITAHVGYSNASDVDAAVSAAKRAFTAWAYTPNRNPSCSVGLPASLKVLNSRCPSQNNPTKKGVRHVEF